MAQASQGTINLALGILRQVAKDNPRAYRMCHADENQHPEAYDYAILGCRALNKIDSKFGMNGKRGSDDPSSDALFYGSQSESSSVVDFVRAGGTQGDNLDHIQWNDVSSAGPGKWLDPFKFNTVGEGTEPDDCEDKLILAEDKIHDLQKEVEALKAQLIQFPEYESLGGDSFFWNTLGTKLEFDYKRAAQQLNAGSAVWFGRATYDMLRDIVVNKVSPNQAAQNAFSKHRPEWCKVLGVEVLG